MGVAWWRRALWQGCRWTWQLGVVASLRLSPHRSCPALEWIVVCGSDPPDEERRAILGLQNANEVSQRGDECRSGLRLSGNWFDATGSREGGYGTGAVGPARGKKSEIVGLYEEVGDWLACATDRLTS